MSDLPKEHLSYIKLSPPPGDNRSIGPRFRIYIVSLIPSDSDGHFGEP